MHKLARVALLFAAMAFSGTAATVADVSVAEAQGGMEYCPDLGVLVQHTDAGLFVRAIRGRGAASQLGLRSGDLIFAVNGNHPDTLSDLHRVLFTGADLEDHDLDILKANGQHVHALVFHDHGTIQVHRIVQ